MQTVTVNGPQIVSEDDDVLVVDKPGGLVCHSASRNGQLSLAMWLRDRGIETIPQLTVGPYNLDLAAPYSIAVEVHRENGMPHRRVDIVKRINYLCDAGWHCCYVWVNRAGLTESATDEVIAFIEFAKSNPSATREYRVIRGTGQRVTVSRNDLN